MPLSVLFLAGVEEDVFADVAVHHLEERFDHRVVLGILAAVMVQVVVLGDEIIQLGPDLGGGAGVGGRTCGNARMSCSVVGSCVDQVDIRGVLWNIDQAGEIGAVTLEVTVIDVGDDAGGRCFPGSPDDRGEMMAVFGTPVGVSDDAVGLIPVGVCQRGGIGIGVGHSPFVPQGQGGAAALHDRLGLVVDIGCADVEI